MHDKRILSHEELKAKTLTDAATLAEYNSLGEEFGIIEKLIETRLKAGLSQADIAARMGTKAPAICRIESPDQRHSPTLRTLQRYASALGCRLEVTLRKRMGR